MRSIRIFAAALVLAVIAALPSAAQTRQPAAPAVGGAVSGAGVAASTGRIAVIDSSAFSDEKEGIARVVNAMKGVYNQFQPMRTEVQNLQQRYDALAKDIAATANVAEPKTIQQKTEQAEALKKEYERKAQDLQEGGQKRMQEVLGPLQEDVASSLQAYAQAHGISLIIDVSRVPVIYAADSVDITKEFIIEYNRAKPATATTSAAPRRP